MTWRFCDIALDAYGTEENEMAEEPGASSGESVCSPASGGSECGPQQPPQHQSPVAGSGSGNDNDSELDSPPRSNSKKSRLGSPDSGAARSAPH